MMYILTDVVSVTAVGGTIHVPEIAVDFSGGGFSDLVSGSLPLQGCFKLIKAFLISSNVQTIKTPSCRDSSRSLEIPTRDYSIRESFALHYIPRCHSATFTTTERDE